VHTKLTLQTQISPNFQAQFSNLLGTELMEFQSLGVKNSGRTGKKIFILINVKNKILLF